MKQKFLPYHALFLLIFLSHFSGTALAAYPLADAGTQSVIIYPDRAMVKKTLHVAVSKGENTLEISGLTPSLIDESVQAGSGGDKKIRILDIEVRRTSLIKTEQGELKELQAAIDKIDEELSRHGNALAVQNNSLTFLQKVVPFPQNQNTSFPTVRDYLLALEQTMTERLARVADLEKKIANLKEKKTALEKEKRNLGPAREDSKNIVVTLYAEAPTTFDLPFTYSLRDVQWTPKYEVRADSLAQRLELNFFAIIRQGSGEDFRNAHIEISTARPDLSGELPELLPWRLDIYTPPVYQGLGRAKASRMEMMEAPQAMTLAMAADEAVAEPEARSEATSMSYILPKRIDLPSDNQPHKLLVSSASAEGAFEYLALPGFAPFASLTADLKNPFLFPLPGGELNVFLDGRFVSTRRVEKPVLSGDEMRLTLGMDETIYVEKKLVKQFTETSGAFSRKIRKHYEYRSEIVNAKARPITLLLRERVPVSAHEEIKVEILAPAPSAAKIGEDGIFTWTLDLAPGEKRQLTTIFDVSYPEDKTITGL